MKFKNKLTPIIFGLAVVASTVLASFAPPLTGTASAAAYGCTFEYADAKQTTISRSGCDGGVTDATYKSIEPGSLYKAWELSEGGCKSNIYIRYKDSSPELLNKVKTSSGCENVSINTLISIGDGASGQDAIDATTKDQAYLAYLSEQLQPIRDSRCKDLQNPTAADACITTYSKAMSTCFDKVFPKIDAGSEDADKKFLDLFAECYVKAIPDVRPRVTQADVKSALGDNVYTDMIAAGEAAINTANTSDGGDACNLSGNPLTWILCPIFDGFGTLTDFLLKEVLTGFLQTSPLTISSSDPVYKIWSSFRIWGNIFLVIALLIIVFGESIAGGLIDAYTAKKVLPRILIAAILINLSYYIVALLVDFTNILGQSIGNVITAPLNGASLSPGAATAGTAGMGLFVGLSGAAVGVTGVVGYLLYTAGLLGAVAGSFVPFLLLFVLIPAFIAVVLVFFTLIFRKAIIMALVLVSPIAFALYCLPNTEKYFRQWWDLLFKTLMIYPIVMVIFAVCDVLAYTAIMANGEGSFFGYLLAFLLQFIPLLLIPFAFSIAGGVIGRLHGVATGIGKRGVEGIKGDARDPDSLQSRARSRRREGMIRGRENAVAGLKKVEMDQGKGRAADIQAGKRTPFRKRVLQSGAARTGRLLNYGDLELARSRMTKDESQRREDKTNYGPDASVRAFFAKRQPDGTYRSMTTGKLFSAAEYQKAQQLHGGGVSEAQTAVDYELGKAEPHQYEQMALNAATLLSEKGFSDGEVQGIMTGVGYKNQAKYLDLKHSNFTPIKEGNKTVGWNREIDHAAIAQNAAVDFGSYPISNMKPAPIQALRDAHAKAELALALPATATAEQYEALGFKATKDGIGPRDLAQRTLTDVESTAATLDTSWRSQQTPGTVSAQAQQVGDADGVPVSGASTGAPGRVNDEIQLLVRQVNQSKARRSGAGGPAPTPTVGP